MKKLIKMLQNARAGEIGVYFAYDGHYKSLKDPVHRRQLISIKQDELRHIQSINLMLEIVGARPDDLKDKIFFIIGKFLGFMCHFTGFFMPMKVAKFIEQIGVNSYEEIALEASDMGFKAMPMKLLKMAETEKDHADYFDGVLSLRK